MDIDFTVMSIRERDHLDELLHGHKPEGDQPGPFAGMAVPFKFKVSARTEEAMLACRRLEQRDYDQYVTGYSDAKRDLALIVLPSMWQMLTKTQQRAEVRSVQGETRARAKPTGWGSW
jgi:hypothetical protein